MNSAEPYLALVGATETQPSGPNWFRVAMVIAGAIAALALGFVVAIAIIDVADDCADQATWEIGQ